MSEVTSEGKKKRGLFVTLSTVLIALLIAFFGVSSYRWYVKRVLRERKRHLYSSVRVEVLNAAGVPNLARNVTLWLRRQGFDVVYYGSAREKLDKTVIVERSDENMKNARLLGDLIGCHEIIKEIDPDRLLEVSLILGKDWQSYFDFREEDFIY